MKKYNNHRSKQEERVAENNYPAKKYPAKVVLISSFVLVLSLIKALGYLIPQPITLVLSPLSKQRQLQNAKTCK